MAIEQFKGFPHCEDAYVYACHVVNGHKLACKWEIAACQRFLDDLTGRTPYTFHLEKAEAAVRFIEKLPHTKGQWARRGEKLALQPWQKFIVANIFGWVDGNDKRRFLEAYVKVGRKNGKSLLAAAIAIRFFCADDEFGAEVYSGATSEKQAWEVFKPARDICERTPALCAEKGIEVNAKSLVILKNGSKFEPLIGNPGDGASPSCAIVDEYMEHTTDELLQTMKTGMGAREQPLLLIITTSGSNIAGPCYMAELEYKKILDGVIDDDRIFSIIYGIDEDDDWTTKDALIKANPNYDVSVSAEFLLDRQKGAIRNALEQHHFKRKHLNQWVGSSVAWLNMEKVNQCADPDLKIEDFKNKPCILSLDLAAKIDLTAFLQVFAENQDGKRHYTVFSKFYLPSETVWESTLAHYQKWANEGYLTVTEGEEIDFNEIEAEIAEMMGEYDVQRFVYDPWRAKQLAQKLEDYRVPVVEIVPTKKYTSEPMREIEAAIEGGRFHFDGNPILSWCLSNTVAKVDIRDNISPDKEKVENKIDGTVALIMAVGQCLNDEDTSSVYETRGLRTVS